MKSLHIVLLFILPFCFTYGKDYKAETIDKMKQDYRNLKTIKHQEVIKEFDKYFDADLFRHRYYISLSKNGFAIQKLDKYPDLENTIYIVLDASSVSGKSSIFRLSQKVVKQDSKKLRQSLEQGYAECSNHKHMKSLEDISGVVVAMSGDLPPPAVDEQALTMILHMQGRYIAISAICYRQSIKEMVNTFKELAKTGKMPKERKQSLIPCSTNE